MGKTGTTLWAQVKGVKGQIRLVPKKEGEHKTPGPNQRFKAGANTKQIDQMAEAMGGRSGGRGGKRGGRRGGDRSGGSGMNESTANPMIRRHMRRPKVSALGAKAKSGR
ncbi:MAG: DUF5350 domain-containing protein [Methanoregula sp.]|jgi:hypothetical protein